MVSAEGLDASADAPRQRSGFYLIPTAPSFCLSMHARSKYLSPLSRFLEHAAHSDNLEPSSTGGVAAQQEEQFMLIYLNLSSRMRS
jgi:hypothetical protein